MSNSLGRRLSVPRPTATPSTKATTTDSAAPTRRTTRRPRHSLGTVTVVAYTPVGLASGTSGRSPGNGMTTLV